MQIDESLWVSDTIELESLNAWVYDIVNSVISYDNILDPQKIDDALILGFFEYLVTGVHFSDDDDPLTLIKGDADLVQLYNDNYNHCIVERIRDYALRLIDYKVFRELKEMI